MSNTFIHKSLNLSLKQLRMCANESRIPGPKSVKYLKLLDTYCQWPSSTVGRFPFPYTFTTTEHSHLEKRFHLVDNDASILKFGVFTTNKVFIFIGLLYFFHFELLPMFLLNSSFSYWLLRLLDIYVLQILFWVCHLPFNFIFGDFLDL